MYYVLREKAVWPPTYIKDGVRGWRSYTHDVEHAWVFGCKADAEGERAAGELVVQRNQEWRVYDDDDPS